MVKIIWTEEMLATAIGMKRAGISTEAIARRLGVPPKSVDYRLRRMKVQKYLDGKSKARPKGGRILNSCLSPVTMED